MPTYRLTPDARTDLINIRRFTLTNWGADQSRKYLDKLRQTMQLLSATPSLGKSRPDIGAGVHSFPHGSHVIYYLVHANQLVVFGVLHKQMVPEKHLEQRSSI